MEGFLAETPFVNGVRFPRIEVASALDRLRILGAANARIFLILSACTRRWRIARILSRRASHILHVRARHLSCRHAPVCPRPTSP
jgi:hypothetical protein